MDIPVLTIDSLNSWDIRWHFPPLLARHTTRPPPSTPEHLQRRRNPFRSNWLPFPQGRKDSNLRGVDDGEPMMGSEQ